MIKYELKNEPYVKSTSLCKITAIHNEPTTTTKSNDKIPIIGNTKQFNPHCNMWHLMTYLLVWQFYWIQWLRQWPQLAMCCMRTIFHFIRLTIRFSKIINTGNIIFWTLTADWFVTWTLSIPPFTHSTNVHNTIEINAVNKTRATHSQMLSPSSKLKTVCRQHSIWNRLQSMQIECDTTKKCLEYMNKLRIWGR